MNGEIMADSADHRKPRAILIPHDELAPGKSFTPMERIMKLRAREQTGEDIPPEDYEKVTPCMETLVQDGWNQICTLPRDPTHTIHVSHGGDGVVFAAWVDTN